MVKSVSIELDDATLHVEERGSPNGRAIVFLHGGAGSSQDWHQIIDRFTTYRCILVDSRGHGASTRTDEPLTYPQLASDAEQVIASFGLVDPIVIGHSDGGITGLQIAFRENVGLSALVTIAAHGWAPQERIMREIYEPLTAERWRARFPEMVALYEQVNPDPDFDGFFEWLVRMWRDGSPANYPGDRVARIACPTLVIGGDRDHLVPRDQTFALAERIPKAELGIVPLGTHVPHWDNPNLVGGWIETFLDEKAG